MTLDEAEKRAADLLGQLNRVERSLGACSPNDPLRASLKAEKLEILTRYHGAKATVKHLRRTTNGTKAPKGVDPVVLSELHICLNEVLESDLADQLTKAQLAAITVFCDRMDREVP